MTGSPTPRLSLLNQLKGEETDLAARLREEFRLDGEVLVRNATGNRITDRRVFLRNHGEVVTDRIRFFLANGWLPLNVGYWDRNPSNRALTNLRSRDAMRRTRDGVPLNLLRKKL